MNTKRPDLNLLVVLDAIERSGSVTGAADALALSQPAISHALNRLRKQIGDPIYVRGRGGLVVTPRGALLIQQARSVIAAAQAAFTPVQFDAATTRQAFRLVTSDYSSLTLVPHLFSAFHTQAPHARLETLTVSAETLEALERGNADCSYWGTQPPGAPFEHYELFRERMVLVARRSNPLMKRRHGATITLEEYCAQSHVVVSLRDPGRSRLEAELTARGCQRRIAMVGHSFAAALAAVRETDLIAALPERLVAHPGNADLCSLSLPFEMPDYPYFLLWHSRSTCDEAMRWFRDLVQTSVETVTTVDPKPA